MITWGQGGRWSRCSFYNLNQEIRQRCQDGGEEIDREAFFASVAEKTREQNTGGERGRDGGRQGGQGWGGGWWSAKLAH